MMNDKIKRELEESEFPWIKDRLILLTRTGSQVYGTATGNSDEDFMGVCIPPEEYFYGLNSFGGYDKTGSKNFNSSNEEDDVRILHVGKFLEGLMNGAPNYVELLYVDTKEIVKVTPLGQKLLDNRDMFITKHMVKRCMGYARGQENGMLNGRKNLINKYGYDTKHFTHSVRLYRMAKEILTGDGFNVYRKDRGELKELRNGKYTYEEAVTKLRGLENDVKGLWEHSTLPDEVDRETVDKLLVSIVREALVTGKM